jgi:dUTP pyrophosphatase
MILKEIKMKVKRLTPDAIPPTRAHASDAGLDLYAGGDCYIEPGESRAVHTGIAIEIPEGYVGLIWPRSGLALKNGIDVLGGVIDSGYRGEIIVILVNHSRDNPFFIEYGDKIAQLLVQKVELVEVELVDTLESAERGERGFGSTG